MDSENETEKASDEAKLATVVLILGALAVLIFAFTYFQTGSLLTSCLAVVFEFVIGGLWVAWEVAFKESGPQ